jgi:hypothetical protein
VSGGDVPTDKIRTEKHNYDYSVRLWSDFLNPTERVDLAFILSGKPSEINVEYRQPDLETRVVKPGELDTRSLARALLQTSAYMAFNIGRVSIEVRKQRGDQ